MFLIAVNRINTIKVRYRKRLMDFFYTGKTILANRFAKRVTRNALAREEEVENEVFYCG